MNETELQEVLRLHLLWLDDAEGGQRADLSDADLRGANLSDAYLRRCSWCNANLHQMLVSYRGNQVQILFEPAD